MTRRTSPDDVTRRTVLKASAVGASALVVPVPAAAHDEHEDDEEADDGDGTGDDGGEMDDAGELEIVAELEPPSLPENIAIDEEGTVYLSMAPTGEIAAFDSDGTESSVATIETGEGFLLGVTVLDGTLYAANASGESETHGVWRVDIDSEAEAEAERIAELPAGESMPNGIMPHPAASETLLVSDHLGGAIWSVTTDGEAEPWVQDESLEPDMDADLSVGADGLAVHPDGDVYVDNLNMGSVVRVPVEDEDAGDPETVVQDEALVGADGMTFDEEGSLYVAVNAQNTIARVTPEHDVETVVDDEALDFPADVHFGRTEEESTSLFIANFALGTFLQDEDAAEPSLAKVDVGVSGYFPEAGDDATDEDDGMADEDDNTTDEGDDTADEDGNTTDEDDA